MESWNDNDRSGANDTRKGESTSERGKDGNPFENWLDVLATTLDAEMSSPAKDSAIDPASDRVGESVNSDSPILEIDESEIDEPAESPTPPSTSAQKKTPEKKTTKGRLQQLMSQHFNAPISLDFLKSSKQPTSKGGRLQQLLAAIDGQTPPPEQTPPTPVPDPPPAPRKPSLEPPSQGFSRPTPEPAPEPAPETAPEPSPEWEEMQNRLAFLEDRLERLQGQIYEPTELIDPLLPLINELLTQRVQETQAGICDMLVPVIDRVILEKSRQDIESLSEAMADVIPMAITQEIQNSPEEIASAIAPEVAAAIRKQIQLDRDSIKDALASEMGRAIKGQIELERDAMVDALYPVIGATISKYMGEAVREINAKVENALSVQGVERKIRAKLQGVSEAELILKESMPCIVEAIFLIHKASGLIISEVQNVSGEKLESDMIAGMLTAIRSFANDCIARGNHHSELNEIEYSGSKIVLEVAGYCYLAVSIRGEPSKSFLEQMRTTLGKIVQKYDRQLEEFDGDPDSVPEAVQQHLDVLMYAAERENQNKQSKSRPTTVLLLGALLLLATLITGGWQLYRHQIEKRALSAWASTPELAIYRLDARVRGRKLTLSGKLPDEFSRAVAERVVREALPQRQIDNRILAVRVAPNPTAVQSEVERLVEFFNELEGVDIWADYIDNQVKVRGTIDRAVRAEQLTQALASIPGVSSVVSTLNWQDIDRILAARIYFNRGSIDPSAAEIAKIEPIRQALEQNPDIKLKIIGHSDITGRADVNLSLAEQRASAVKQNLVDGGIESDRLLVEGSTQRPPKVTAEQPLALSRCVRFEPIRTADGQTTGNNGNDL